MRARHGLVLTLLVAAAGCASTPPPTQRPIVVETEQVPFEVQAYVPPPDELSPPDAPPPAAVGKPAQDGGVYRISVATLKSADGAQQWVRRAESLGYRAEVETLAADGATLHRVVLPGYSTKADVLRALEQARTDFAAPEAWRLPNK